MPYPRKDESKDDFMARCMGNDEMQRRHPNKDDRTSACERHWDSGKKKSSANALVDDAERRSIKFKSLHAMWR
jgi:hypothetical protein